MSWLRLPLRLARRDAWRRPGRTAIVALLVAVPVAAMAFTVVLIRTDRNTTPIEDWQRRSGQADAVRWEGGGSPKIRAGELPMPEGYRRPDPPEGSRIVAVTQADYLRIRTAGDHRADVTFSDLPLLDPISVGIHDLVAGRTATKTGEIVLAAELAERLDLGVGDELVLDRPIEATFKVVGLIEPVRCLSCPYALVPAGDAVLSRLVDHPLTHELVDLPDDISIEDQQALLESGAVDEVRDLITDPSFPAAAYTADEDDATTIRWTLVIGALVLTVAGVVISAAFAVGARRQLVTLGQLSASGAPPSVVRTALMLVGTVTGVVGVVLGLAIAALALLLGESWVEDILDRRISGYAVRLPDLLLVVAVGVLAATIAALIPARTAARIPTLAALAGRRPLSPVSGRLVARGAGAFVGGLALFGIAVVGGSNVDNGNGDLWAYVAIAGGVLELLGACAVAPAVVARLEPLAARLRGGLRLGARSLARNRSRTGAVVSAVAAAGALAVAASGLILGSEAKSELENADLAANMVVASEFVPPTELDGPERQRPASAELREEILSILPGADEVELSTTVYDPQQRPATEGPTGPKPGFEAGFEAYWGLVGPDGVTDGGFFSGPDVVDDEILDLMGAGDDVRDSLDEGLVVVMGMSEETVGPDGRLQVQLPDGRQIDAVAGTIAHRLGYGSSLLISPERAEDLGLRVQPSASVFVVDHDLTAAERDDVEDLAYVAAGGPDGFASIDWYRPSSGPSPFELELILTGIALVFSLFVVGLSLALAAAEGKDERDIMTIAGAPPASIARSAGARAWLMSAIGGAMAIPVGFLPVLVFVRAETSDEWNHEWPLVFPARTAVILLVVVPAVLAAVAWTASSMAQRLRPVRVSTATFE